MAEIHEHDIHHEDHGNFMGLFMGIILLLLVIFLFFYLLLLFRNRTQFNIPGRIDINLHQAK